MKNPRLVVFLFFAAFFIIGGYLLMSAQGLFIDWQTLKIIHTGGAFFYYSPKDAQLTVNSKNYGTSSFFLNNGTLIKNLKPGFYNLDLSKEKFRSWKKTFEVKPGLVTEFKKITLIEEKLKKETLTASAVKTFWLTNKGPVYQNSKNQLYFNDYRLSGQNVSAADKDSSLLITKNNQEFFLTDLNKPQITVNLSRLFNSLKQRQLKIPGQIEIQKTFFHPSAKNEILIATNQAIYELDLKLVKMEKIIGISPEAIIRISQNQIFFKKDAENSSVYNLLSHKIDEKEINLKNPKRIEIGPDSKLIAFLNQENRLFIYDSQTGKIEEPLENEKIQNFSFSPDNLYLSMSDFENKIRVMNIKEKTISEIYKEETKDEFSWLEDLPHYLLIKNGSQLLLKDIFGQSDFNEYSITEEVIEYKNAGRTVYILDTNKTLTKLEL
ncbi:MAG: hypothetical protein Q8L36_03290 [bacterium]|nr:hypothetical protein [bacterium]